MRGVNKVLLIGNATRDAELRYTQTGKAVFSTRLATNRTVKGEEESQFHAIVCWDRLAETTAKSVKNGDPPPSKGGCEIAISETKRVGNTA